MLGDHDCHMWRVNPRIMMFTAQFCMAVIIWHGLIVKAQCSTQARFRISSYENKYRRWIYFAAFTAPLESYVLAPNITLYVMQPLGKHIYP